MATANLMQQYYHTSHASTLHRIPHITELCHEVFAVLFFIVLTPVTVVKNRVVLLPSVPPQKHPKDV